MLDTDQNPFIGAVVRSTAGRDRHRVFIVCGLKYTDSYPLLAVSDGALRRMEQKKYKNPRHVKVIGHLTETEMDILRSNPDNETVKRLVFAYDRHEKT